MAGRHNDLVLDNWAGAKIDLEGTVMSGSKRIPIFDSIPTASGAIERLGGDIATNTHDIVRSPPHVKPLVIRKREPPTQSIEVAADTGIVVRRIDTTITANANGMIARSFECRSVRAAVELEIKLNSDIAFAEWWAFDGTAKPPKPNTLER